MRLGMVLGYAGARLDFRMDEVLEAERLGFDSIWTSEAYSSDAVSLAAWVLARTSRIRVGTAIMQMPARTPACTAMTAMTLQALSGNRFILGLGPSGPQVVEGWHGVPYGKPLERTREYVSIVRKVLAREAPLEHEGAHYQIPYRGPGASGLGKPLKSILHGDPRLPIYTASIAPAGLRTAGEIADGVIPVFLSPERWDVIGRPALEGLARRNLSNADGPRTLAEFDIAPFVKISMGDDLQACRDALKPELALYIGGMGARSKNFYNDYAKRLGYEAAAARIQDLFLGGRKAEAAAAVPDALVDEIALVGPEARIRERLQVWAALARDHKIGTLILSGATVEALRAAAEALL